MTTDLSATLRRMADGEHVAEPEGVLCAAAHLIDRMASDLARRDGLTDAELMAHYRPGEPATSADSGPGRVMPVWTPPSDTRVISGRENGREGMRT